MSLEDVQTIIGRALTEAEYRELLFSEPEKALEGYELSEKEAAALKGLEREKFDAVAAEQVDGGDQLHARELPWLVGGSIHDLALLL